jgi:hypothetical protein
LSELRPPLPSEYCGAFLHLKLHSFWLFFGNGNSFYTLNEVQNHVFQNFNQLLATTFSKKLRNMLEEIKNSFFILLEKLLVSKNGRIFQVFLQKSSKLI